MLNYITPFSGYITLTSYIGLREPCTIDEKGIEQFDSLYVQGYLFQYGVFNGYILLTIRSFWSIHFDMRAYSIEIIDIPLLHKEINTNPL